MQYLGGKAKIAERLGAYLRQRGAGLVFCEPFCGGLSITVTQAGRRLAADASPYLITLYRAVRGGWNPPEHVDKETYDAVRSRMDPTDPLTAFVGYGCSFGGKFFAGFAYGPPDHSGGAYNGPNGYSLAARRSLLRDLARCSDVSFATADFREWNFKAGRLVYCDPPYAGTTGYAAVGGFDSSAFWRKAEAWSRAGALVLVSEYTAPEGWACVWSEETKTDLHGGGRSGRTERLFEYRG